MDKIALGSDPQRMSEASEFEPDEEQEPVIVPEWTDDGADGPKHVQEIARYHDEEMEDDVVLIVEDDVLFMEQQWREGDDELQTCPIKSLDPDGFDILAKSWLEYRGFTVTVPDQRD